MEEAKAGIEKAYVSHGLPVMIPADTTEKTPKDYISIPVK
jgi:hypothetical protein